jgi:hypothetical protein
MRILGKTNGSNFGGKAELSQLLGNSTSNPKSDRRDVSMVKLTLVGKAFWSSIPIYILQAVRIMGRFGADEKTWRIHISRRPSCASRIFAHPGLEFSRYTERDFISFSR